MADSLWRFRGTPAEPDNRGEASALFARFADRHALRFHAVDHPALDLCWEFPAQERLSRPISLALQNTDELNFGVADFWSYFFPIGDVSARVEAILDAWVGGEARIAMLGRRTRLLEVRQPDGSWAVEYRANPPLFRTLRKPDGFISNRSDRVLDTCDQAMRGVRRPWMTRRLNPPSPPRS